MYRTAPLNVTTTDLPDRQATITAKPYSSAMSFHHDGMAYLEPLSPEKTDTFIIRDGQLYLGDGIRQLSDTDMQTLTTDNYIDVIDLDLLRTLYSIMLKEYERNECEPPKESIVLYVPQLFEALGKKRNQSQEQIKALIAEINKFKNVLGVCREVSVAGRPPRCSYYALINFNYYNAGDNTISFSAPYLIHVITKIREYSLRRDKNGKVCASKSGKPKTLPTHSYLIKSAIAAERNECAVENVNIIVRLIEQAGNSVPHIKAMTIVERNPILKQRLSECIPRCRQQLLDRTFKKTWELLRTMTYLEETYPGIQLPDPAEKSNLPKLKELSCTTFSFPHVGKLRGCA